MRARILYIYHMASRVAYQNISPEVTRRPSPCALYMSPDAEGMARQGFRVAEGLIFWYSRPRRHVIYVM